MYSQLYLSRLRNLLSRRRAHATSEEVRHDRAIRTHQSERQIDNTLKDTFPASDPPSWY